MIFPFFLKRFVLVIFEFEKVRIQCSIIYDVTDTLLSEIFWSCSCRKTLMEVMLDEFVVLLLLLYGILYDKSFMKLTGL